MKHLSGAQLYGRLLALPTNIRLGWKGLPGTNALAYYEKAQLTAIKCITTLATDRSHIRQLAAQRVEQPDLGGQGPVADRG